MRQFLKSLIICASLLTVPMAAEPTLELAYLDEGIAIVIFGFDEEIWIEAHLADGLLWTAFGLFEVDDQGLINLTKFYFQNSFNLEDS